MTRGSKNTRTGVSALEAAGRLRKARAFHHMACNAMEVLEAAQLDRAPVLSNAVLAAIAYTDAVTIAADGSLNQKDHTTAPALLRACIGREVPEGRLSDLRALLAAKDDVQYGTKAYVQDSAAQGVEQLNRFAAWALDWLAQRGIT